MHGKKEGLNQEVGGGLVIGLVDGSGGRIEQVMNHSGGAQRKGLVA